MGSEYKQYLGDSVYADFDGFQIVLTKETSEDGISVSNRIYLEPVVLNALNNYWQWLNDTVKEHNEKQ